MHRLINCFPQLAPLRGAGVVEGPSSVSTLVSSLYQRASNFGLELGGDKGVPVVILPMTSSSISK